jgi:hypothetical protein
VRGYVKVLKRQNMQSIYIFKQSIIMNYKTLKAQYKRTKEILKYYKKISNLYARTLKIKYRSSFTMAK